MSRSTVDFVDFIDVINDLSAAMEAPTDVTGDTAAGTKDALGPNARTNEGNDNAGGIDTDNIDSPAEMLSGGEGQDADPEDDTQNDEEGDATDDETGKDGDPAEGEEDPDANTDDTPTEDATDDPEEVKKARLKSNMIELHRIIQKNSAMLSKCNVSTISTMTGKANNSVINILNDVSDIIYNIITDGSWNNTPYSELMRKYVGINMVFDLAIKMLNETVTAAEKERDADLRASKRRNSGANRVVREKHNKNLGLDGVRP